MDKIRATIDVMQLAALRQQHIGRLLQRANRQFTDQAVTKLHARGHAALGLAHASLLSYLDLDGTRITVLAERASITKQAMGQLVAELESQGYVARTPDPDDRRATLVQFTAAGWQFLLDASAIKREIESEYRLILGDDRFAALQTLLELLLDDHPAGANSN